MSAPAMFADSLLAGGSLIVIIIVAVLLFFIWRGRDR